MVRYCLLSLLLFGLVGGGGALAQPADGDIIVCFHANGGGDGMTWSVNPRTGVASTIVPPGATKGYYHRWVGMAEDNADMVVTLGDPSVNRNGWVARLRSSGALSTIAIPPGGNVNACDLDGNGQWLLAAGGKPRKLWSLPTSGGSVTTLFTNAKTPVFHAMVIDRDPGPTSFPYVIGTRDTNHAGLLGADRMGIRTTIAWGADLKQVTWVDLDPVTGDYLVSTVTSLLRVPKAGARTTLASGGGFGAIRMAQDRTIWTGGGTQITHRSSTGQALSTLTVGLAGYSIMGVEIYGSRRLVCNGTGQPGTSVTVNIQSRHPLAGGQSYILAASPARRPGMRFVSGEWLNLDVTHPLFWWTAQNLDPKMFVNFRGVLNGNGNNTQPIQVNIPKGLPKLNNMAIFVGGVIYNPKNNMVIQVTNSHWFVLP